MRVEGDLVIPVPGILQVAVFPSGRALEIEHFGLVIEDLQPGLSPVVFLESLSLDSLEADAQLVSAGFVDLVYRFSDSSLRKLGQALASSLASAEAKLLSI